MIEPLKVQLVCIGHASPLRVIEGRSMFRVEGEPPLVSYVLDWEALECLEMTQRGTCRFWATVDHPDEHRGRIIFKDPKTE